MTSLTGDLPPYLQVASDLRAKIASGSLAVGDRIPSGRDLASTYGVAPMTAQKATDLLKDEGLIETWPGRGIYVVRKPAATQEQVTLEDLAAQVAELRQGLDHLSETVESAAVGQIREEIAELGRQVATLQAQLADLNDQGGQPGRREQRKGRGRTPPRA